MTQALQTAVISGLTQARRFRHETHISTLSCSPQAYARLSGSHAFARRSFCDSCASRQGPGTSVGLNDVQMAEFDQGFRPSYRLRKTDEFSSVFAFRKSLRSAHFQLLYRPNGSASARLGTVMAKKLAKRAVERNLLKRLGRESFRAVRSELLHYDFVLRLAVSPTQATKGQLRAELDGLFKRLM